MFKNYLKIAIRNLFKNKLHSSINILGLGIAIAVCILGYVNYQFSQSYDRFHEHGESIYAIHSECAADGNEAVRSQVPMPLGPDLRNDMPGISALTRLGIWDGNLNSKGDVYFHERLAFVDPDFLRMLSYPMMKGNQQALDNPRGLVVTQEVAERLFGDEEAIGQRVTIDFNSHDFFDFQITGVIQNAPSNTALQYSILLPFERISDIRKKDRNHWRNRTEACFIQLTSNDSKEQIETHLEKRTKEIAVRKILGASLVHLSKILMKEFAVLFGIALVITASAGSLLISMMMGSIWEAYTGLDAFSVIIAAFSLIGITVVTLGMQLFRVQRENPVESLRYE